MKRCRYVLIGALALILMTGSACAKQDQDLAAKAKEKFGDRCTVEKTCDDMAYVNCGAEYDGPAYYVQTETLDVISTCGGTCMNPNTPCECPPKVWTCTAE